MHDDVRVIDDKLEFFLNGKQISINGEFVAAENPDYPIGQLFKEFFETKLGETFLEEYGLDTINPQTGLTNSKVIEQVFKKLYGFDPRATLTRITDCVQSALNASELTPMPVEAEPTRPRTPDGKFADERAMHLAEYHRLLSDSTVPASEISRRLKSDKQFRNAVESEGRPQPPRVIDLPSAELKDFARAWRATPSPRFLGGVAKIGNFELTPAQLEQYLSDASRFNLL